MIQPTYTNMNLGVDKTLHKMHKMSMKGHLPLLEKYMTILVYAIIPCVFRHRIKIKTKT